MTWTVERLRRTVRRLAAEGIVEASLLDRARPQQRRRPAGPPGRRHQGRST